MSVTYDPAKGSYCFGIVSPYQSANPVPRCLRSGEVRARRRSTKPSRSSSPNLNGEPIFIPNPELAQAYRMADLR